MSAVWIPICVISVLPIHYSAQNEDLSATITTPNSLCCHPYFSMSSFILCSLLYYIAPIIIGFKQNCVFWNVTSFMSVVTSYVTIITDTPTLHPTYVCCHNSRVSHSSLLWIMLHSSFHSVFVSLSSCTRTLACSSASKSLTASVRCLYIMPDKWTCFPH